MLPDMQGPEPDDVSCMLKSSACSTSSRDMEASFSDQNNVDTDSLIMRKALQLHQEDIHEPQRTMLSSRSNYYSSTA